MECNTSVADALVEIRDCFRTNKGGDGCEKSATIPWAGPLAICSGGVSFVPCSCMFSLVKCSQSDGPPYPSADAVGTAAGDDGLCKSAFGADIEFVGRGEFGGC